MSANLRGRIPYAPSVPPSGTAAGGGAGVGAPFSLILVSRKHDADERPLRMHYHSERRRLWPYRSTHDVADVISVSNAHRPLYNAL